MFTDETGNAIFTAGVIISIVISSLLTGGIGALSAHVNGDNPWVGFAFGFLAGAISGVGAAYGGALISAVIAGEKAVEVLGTAAVIAYGSGFLADGINYVATELFNGRSVNLITMLDKAHRGGKWNLFSAFFSGWASDPSWNESAKAIAGVWTSNAIGWANFGFALVEEKVRQKYGTDNSVTILYIVR